MKEYVCLSIDAKAYYSGSTYYEEVFLPKEVWEEIKDDFRLYTYLYGFDGKHSEVKADINVVEMGEKVLSTYTHPVNDGETLFDHVYEYLDADKYDSSWLLNIQEEVEALCQVDTMTIKFNKQNRDKILEILSGLTL